MKKEIVALVLCCLVQNGFAADADIHHQEAIKILRNINEEVNYKKIYKQLGVKMVDRRMREEITFVERATPGGYGCELCYEPMGKEDEAFAALLKKPFFTKYFAHRERSRIKFESKPPEAFVFWHPTSEEKKQLYNLPESGYWDVAQYRGDDALFVHLSDKSLSEGRLRGIPKTLLLVCGVVKSDFDKSDWRRYDLAVDTSRRDDFEF